MVIARKMEGGRETQTLSTVGDAGRAHDEVDGAKAAVSEGAAIRRNSWRWRIMSG